MAKKNEVKKEVKKDQGKRKPVFEELSAEEMGTIVGGLLSSGLKPRMGW